MTVVLQAYDDLTEYDAPNYPTVYKTVEMS